MKQKTDKIKDRKPLSKKKKKRIIIILAAVVLVAAAGYTVFIAPLLEKEQWIYKEEVVERGTLKVGVTESGSLEYGIQSVMYDLDLDVSDDEDEDEDEEEEEEAVQKYLKIQEVYVVAGQRVEAGDALIKLSEDSVQDVRKLLESALVDAKSEYNDAESEYKLSALEAQTDYDILKLSEKYATDIYERGTTSIENDITAMQVEINQRTAQIASLQESLAEAQEDYQEALVDYTEAEETMSQTGMDNTVNFMTIQSGYLSAQTKYENAKSALKQAQSDLDDNQEQIDYLQKKMAAAQAEEEIAKLNVEASYQESLLEGENAQITYNAQLEGLEETLQEAEEEKNKLEEQLQAFEEFVGEDGILYATESGIVTEVSYEAEDRLRNTGVILSYATPGDMTISVDVTQEDIVDLQVGDSVDITFRAYEDTTYTGKIISIDTTATAANSNTVSYTVVIGVEGDTQLLYGGMSADVIFVTEQKEDVLFVSRKAIVEENGKSYVYCQNARGGKELTEVETGITNGVDIEILSGLEEGDTIYLASRVSSEEEVRSTSEETTEGQTIDLTTQQGMEIEIPEGFSGDLPGGMSGGDASGSGMPGTGSGEGASRGGMPGGSGGGIPGNGGSGGGMPGNGG